MYLFCKKSLSILAILVIVCLNFSLTAVFASSATISPSIVVDPYKIEFIGADSAGQFGASLGSGDFNGDGFDDLVVGSPFASTDLKEWNGKVSIIFGYGDSANSQLDLGGEAVKNSVIRTFSGDSSGDQLGTAMSVGDYNSDGFDDIAIGAYNAFYDEGRPGVVYVYYGHVAMGSQSSDTPLDKADLVLTGNSDGDKFGLSMSTVDYNADSVDDLLISSPSASVDMSHSGLVEAYPGSSQGLSSGVDIVFHGQNLNEGFGSSISSGHVVDLQNISVVIGAYRSSVEENTQAGRVYVFTAPFGEDDVEISDITIDGKDAMGWLGFDLLAADINGDYYDDIFASSFAFGDPDNAGNVGVYYGGDLFFDTADVLFSDQFGDSLLGASITKGDYDRDGIMDYAFGAPGISSGVVSSAGAVYVMYGNDGGFELDSVITGENNNDWFGYSVDSLDFDGDEYDDLAIGARYADSEDGVNEGKVYILLGRDDNFGGQIELPSENEGNFVSRAELISDVLDSFDLRAKKAPFLNSCYRHTEFCLFNFMAASLYDSIEVKDEILLYPDVPFDYQYYDDITVGTMLGLVNGYMDEAQSPFKPDAYISRIQALKIILTAVDFVPPKYRFELVASLGSAEALASQESYFEDVDPAIPYMWWYPRYLNYAVMEGIVPRGDYFRPDEYITKTELAEMIQAVQESLLPDGEMQPVNNEDEETNTSGGSEEETLD